MRVAWTRFQPLTPLRPGQVKTAFRPLSWGGGTLSWMNNGEGTLFYPGVREADGFVPMHGSMRLANLRDGIEDYEYYIQASKIDRAAAPPPTTLYANGMNRSHDPAAYQAEKTRLAALILSRGPAPAPGNAPPRFTVPPVADPPAARDMRTVVRAEAVDPDDAPRELLYAWSVLTGPANGVEFARSNEAESEVTFNKPGTYRLRLIVTDGHAYAAGTWMSWLEPSRRPRPAPTRSRSRPAGPSSLPRRACWPTTAPAVVIPPA